MQETLNVVVGQSPAELTGPSERLDWLDNAVASIGGRPADLIVLPELFLTGYNVGDRIDEWAQSRDGNAFRRIADIAQKNSIAIHFGYAERDGQQLFNSAACVDITGTVIGTHRKLLLPPGFEANHFAAGRECTTFTIGAFTNATLICYDAEFPETFRHLAAADLVLVPTALAAQWGVVANRVIPARAFENGIFVCYANHAGHENGIDYLGGSCVVAPDGKDLARAGGSEQLLFASLDKSRVKAARDRLPYHRDLQKLPWIAAG
ncbi:MAG: carbon-nitrogen hydrolase family protein [Hyphomicrobiales bacterium]|nr:carbon-nitrogen hydrolase family protein [Hyphomicrobiales bacterium]MCP5001603.1 carbon-nitrogen hydrolase family protein [Hyphomicrobiales bacterium]